MAFKYGARAMIAELRRRHVFRVGVAYLLVAWILIQVTDNVAPALQLPTWTLAFVIVILSVGFSVALVLAWVFDLTTGGVERTPARTRLAPAFDRRNVRETTSERRASVVVLPFADLSDDAANEYFSDGLTEEVIADLSHLRGLRVISRTSAMKLKGSDKSLRDIGDDLGVDYALEGSVRKVGRQIRVTAQLIDVRGDSHIWGHKYDGTLDDVFAIQERLARSIVAALKLQLTQEEDAKLRSTPMGDPRAYDTFLLARREVLSFTSEGLDRAMRLIQDAASLIGPNEALLTLKGFAHFQLANLGISPEASLDRAIECADAVAELNPASAQAAFLHGIVAILRGSLPSAIKHLAQAVDRDPNMPDALSWISLAYSMIGRTDRARLYAQRLESIDPLVPAHYAVIGYVDLLEGHFSTARSVYARMYAMDPGNSFLGMVYLLALSRTGDEADARIVIGDLEREAPEDLTTAFARVAYSSLHVTAGKAEILTPAVLDACSRDGQMAYEMGAACAKLGWREDALGLIDVAARRGFVNYPYISTVDPLLAPLRSDPAFDTLLTRIKTRWEQYGEIAEIHGSSRSGVIKGSAIDRQSLSTSLEI